MSSVRRASPTRLGWMLALVFAATYASLPPAVAWFAPRCHGQSATIVGTSRDDSLAGTLGVDVILGLAGNDRIRALGGDDVICSGSGRDYVEAGPGADFMSGARGMDSLLGEGGDDEIRGGRTNDWIVGGDGADTLQGGRGPSDLIEEGPGNDLIDGGPGTGDDVGFGYAGSGGVTVDLATGVATGAGTDRLSGIEGVLGTSSDDVLTGDDRPNALVGGRGNDVLSSGGGGSLDCAKPQPSNVAPVVLRCADILVGDTGDDTLTGGTGFDVGQYWDSPPVTVDLGKGTAIGDGTDALSGIEGVWGSRNDDTLIGDAGDNFFLSDQGNDMVQGAGGTDIASFGDVASVSVDLRTGSATGEYFDGSGRWTYTLSGIEDIWGTDGADTMTGDAGPNDLRGFRGSDTISGGDGDDRLDGGAGNDMLDGGAGTDACLNGEIVMNCE